MKTSKEKAVIAIGGVVATVGWGWAFLVRKIRWISASEGYVEFPNMDGFWVFVAGLAVVLLGIVRWLRRMSAIPAR